MHWGVTLCLSKTPTLDSRSLAYFSCRPAANSDYYPTVLGKWAHLVFSSASLLLLGYDGVFQDACCCWWRRGGHIVWVWLSFLYAIKKAWFRKMAHFLIQSLTTEHTSMTNCIILALKGEYIHFYWSLMGCLTGFPFRCVCVHARPANIYTRAKLPVTVLSGQTWHFLHIFFNHSYFALMQSGVQ